MIAAIIKNKNVLSCIVTRRRGYSTLCITWVIFSIDHDQNFEACLLPKSFLDIIFFFFRLLHLDFERDRVMVAILVIPLLYPSQICLLQFKDRRLFFGYLYTRPYFSLDWGMTDTSVLNGFNNLLFLSWNLSHYFTFTKDIDACVFSLAQLWDKETLLLKPLLITRVSCNFAFA